MSYKFSRRRFMAFLSISAAGSVLAACSSTPPAANPTPSTQASSGANPTATKAASTTGTTPGATAGITPTVGQAAATPSATAGGPTPTTVVAGEGSLPVPRKETFFSEDTAKMTVFDSFNPFIPNGWQNQYGAIYTSEFMWIANFASGEMMPWLATDYKYSDDNKTLTIKLNPKVTWNDGQPFTSDDVAFTITMVKGNAKLSGSATYNKYVDSVDAPTRKQW